MTVTLPIDLTDDELMTAIPRLAGDERVATARLVAHLAELQRRKLYLAAGYSSPYAYCREALGHSDDAAYNRLAAADAARRYPAVLEMMADGRLSLTAVRMLAPVLREDTWQVTLAEAAGKTKREIELLIACLAPKPDVPSTVRKLPPPVRKVSPPARKVGAPGQDVLSSGQDIPAAAPAPPGCGAASSAGLSSAPVPERPDESADDRTPAPQPATPATAAKRPIVAPLSPERYRVQFTIGAATEKKLRRLQELLRREIPGGDPAVIFDRAITMLLAKVESRKNGATARPRAARPLAHGSRRVPAETRREVAPRDGEQCTFVAANGRRCTERAFLEYHHAGRPFARGGGPGPGNIALHCRAHNAWEGERLFGRYLPPEVREARVQYDSMRFAVPERQTSVSAGSAASSST